MGSIKKFVIIFKLSLKNFFTLKAMAVFILVFLLSQYSFIKSVEEYNDTLLERIEFEKVEVEIFETLVNWVDYSDKGTGVFFVPAPTTLFFSIPAKLAGLTARVNTIASLNLYAGRKSKGVTNRGLEKTLRFSNIVLYIGSLLALLIGFIPMRKKEYLKQLSGITSPATVFTANIAAGFSLILLGFLVIFGCMYPLGLFLGIQILSIVVPKLLPYFLLMLVMMLSFLVAGCLISCIRKKTKAILVLVIVWLTFVYLIPMTIDTLSEDKSRDIISANKLLRNKLKIVKDFEKNATANYGPKNMSKLEVEQQIVEGYWNNEFKKMESFEKAFLKEITDSVNRNKKMALPFITTFYQSTCDELSSNGYTSYLDFYDYLIKLQRRFLRFWFDQVYYEKEKELKNFIKGNENIYSAKSSLPGNFLSGIIFHGLVLIVLFFAAYLRFVQVLFVKPRNAGSCKDVKLDLPKGKRIIIPSMYHDFNNRFVGVFFGKSKAFEGKVSIDGKYIDKKQDVLYLPFPDNLPEDVRVIDYLAPFKKVLKLPEEQFKELKDAVGNKILEKRFGALDQLTKADILMKIAEANTRCLPIIIDSIDCGLPIESRQMLQGRIANLENNGVTVIFINRDSVTHIAADLLVLVRLLKDENTYLVSTSSISGH